MLKLLMLAGSAVAGLAAVVGWWNRDLVYHVLPFWWTDEPARLARTLDIRRGSRVAEIGAGSGAFAGWVAELVGPEGVVYASDLSRDALDAIERRARTQPNLRPVPALADRTNLSPNCCDAVYMRNVLHHIGRPDEYARDVAERVRDGGRLAIVDLAPGALSHLPPDHGVTPDTVVRAFEAAGFRLERRDDEWGGAMFMLVFSKPAP